MKKQIAWHVAFWIGYTLVYAWLNTSFPAASDLKYELPQRFLRFWVAECMMLPLKLLLTYSFLYWIVPRFLMKGKYLQAGFSMIAILIPIVCLSRVITYYGVYPFLYHEIPQYELISFRRFFYTLLDFASALTIAATVKLLKNRVENQRKEQELIQEKLKSELNFLRAQTNPHFLFNTLNNIYALARKQSELTAPVVLKLSEILRFMLYECSTSFIPLQREIQVIQDYIELEKIRYSSQLKIDTSWEIDDPAQPIAPLLLLPLIENAFTHGISETRFEPFVDVQVILKQGELSVAIANSKSAGDEMGKGGIGLPNVKRQLELIYPGRHELSTKAFAERFEVKLTIALWET